MDLFFEQIQEWNKNQSEWIIKKCWNEWISIQIIDVLVFPPNSNTSNVSPKSGRTSARLITFYVLIEIFVQSAPNLNRKSRNISQKINDVIQINT